MEPASVLNLNTVRPAHAEAQAELVDTTVDDMFTYHRWNDVQVEQGSRVREVLANAVKLIIRTVPAGPDRSAAIRKLREARMDCNSAITHDGRY